MAKFLKFLNWRDLLMNLSLKILKQIFFIFCLIAQKTLHYQYFSQKWILKHFEKKSKMENNLKILLYFYCHLKILSNFYSKMNIKMIVLCIIVLKWRENYLHLLIVIQKIYFLLLLHVRISILINLFWLLLLLILSK